MRQSWETMTSVSAGHIILTPTQPVGSGQPQRESNSVPPDQRSRALPTELPRPPRNRLFLRWIAAVLLSNLVFKWIPNLPPLFPLPSIPPTQLSSLPPIVTLKGPSNQVHWNIHAVYSFFNPAIKENVIYSSFLYRNLPHQSISGMGFDQALS